MKKRIAIIISAILLLSVFSGCQKKEGKKEELDLNGIKTVSELATLECFYRNVAKKEVSEKTLFGLHPVKRKFWIEYTGIAKVGIDMSKVDMRVSGDQITITIPQASVLSTDVELKEEEYYKDSSDWVDSVLTGGGVKLSTDIQNEMFKEAQSEMKEAVKKNTAILEQAKSHAKYLIGNYVNQFKTPSGGLYEIKWVELEPDGGEQNETVEPSETEQS